MNLRSTQITCFAFVSMKVYIGNLPADVRKEEIKDVFSKFGDIIDVRVKCPPNGTSAFAFVEYSNGDDGGAAIDKYHDQDFLGRRLKVEFTKPKRRFEDRPRYDDRGGRGGDRCKNDSSSMFGFKFD